MNIAALHINERGTEQTEIKLPRERQKYFPAFDYLRFFLSLIVVAFHAGILDQTFGAFRTGTYAVQIFFVLSGWLIGGILLRSSPSDIPRFYFNRAARIWIPYFVAVALITITSLVRHQPITSKWWEILFYDLTFVFNLFGWWQSASYNDLMPESGVGNHFWSVCAEEQFYLLAPFLVMVPRIGRTIWFWCAISAIAALSHYWLFFGLVSVGVLAATIQHNIGDWHTTRVARGALLVGFVSFLTATVLQLIPYQLGAYVSAPALILLLAQPGTHSRIGSFLGGISYPMYLNHWMGSHVANFISKKLELHGTVYNTAGAIALGIASGALLYVLIDLPVKKNRDKYFSVGRGKLIAICGFALLITGLVGGLAWRSHL